VEICRVCGDRLVSGDNWTPGCAKARDYLCRQCKAAYNRGRYEAQRERFFQYKYGIAVADYDAMLKAQGGGCAICGMASEENGRYLAVDHSHGTGQVRGLLCNMCNRAIGQLGDNPKLCDAAAAYLRRYEQ